MKRCYYAMLLYILNPERAVTGSRVSVRIMKVTQRYLHATDKCREMAGLVAAKFVTRPDNVKRYLPELIDWTLMVRQWRSCESRLHISECR